MRGCESGNGLVDEGDVAGLVEYERDILRLWSVGWGDKDRHVIMTDAGTMATERAGHDVDHSRGRA